jgi:hypothetical protein
VGDETKAELSRPLLFQKLNYCSLFFLLFSYRLSSSSSFTVVLNRIEAKR